MQFCTECGGALNLFESNDENVCWNCVRKKDAVSPQPVPVPVIQPDDDDLSEAILYHENNMLVLKAKEGWILWSGPDTGQVTLDVIMKRAQKIHTIRKKRHNNKN
ncbi:hypothetical protein [Desulfosediminicola flagellatus]|uniref:hypothetical protein n=1 Tax=Desulfosediminicola flagellatus TaxID=2569541 RepID=UPI0010ABB3A6|nr:hypothetical protein [Desulfosediminicola flagellatus]